VSLRVSPPETLVLLGAVHELLELDLELVLVPPELLVLLLEQERRLADL